MNYTLTLPPDFQKVDLPGVTRWVQALRSGEYEQGTRKLCYHGKYCCLGVLSKVQGRLTAGGCDSDELYTSGLGVDNPLHDTLDDFGRLPNGCGVKIPGLNPPKTVLSACNDSGLTFPQIADIIEQVWKEPTQ